MKGSTMAAAVASAGIVAAALFVSVGVVGATEPEAKAKLRNAASAPVGDVTFRAKRSATEVRVKLTAPEAIARNAFHGFHIHANSDGANGEGCQADATRASSTWFVSADGHWKADGQDHAGHLGDMPSVLINADGSAEMTFMMAKTDLKALKGKAVILHAGADNFGNVPVGTAENQYTANSAAATTATKNTGNSGDRVACGVIG